MHTAQLLPQSEHLQHAHTSVKRTLTCIWPAWWTALRRYPASWAILWGGPDIGRVVCSCRFLQASTQSTVLSQGAMVYDKSPTSLQQVTIPPNKQTNKHTKTPGTGRLVSLEQITQHSLLVHSHMPVANSDKEKEHLLLAQGTPQHQEGQDRTS